MTLLDLDLEVDGFVTFLESDTDSAPLDSDLEAFLLTLTDLDRGVEGFAILLELDTGLESGSGTLDFFLC